jgi:hypothetical protein
LIAVVLFQSHKDRKPSLTFKDVRSFISANGNLGDFEHVRNVQAVTRDLVAVDVDFQMLFAGDLLNCQILDAANVRHRVANIIGQLRNVS